MQETLTDDGDINSSKEHKNQKNIIWKNKVMRDIGSNYSTFKGVKSEKLTVSYDSSGNKTFETVLRFCTSADGWFKSVLEYMMNSRLQTVKRNYTLSIIVNFRCTCNTATFIRFHLSLFLSFPLSSRQNIITILWFNSDCLWLSVDCHRFHYAVLLDSYGFNTILHNPTAKKYIP